MMDVRRALSQGVAVLGGGTSETPFLDASVLLAAALGVDKSVLLSDHGRTLPDDVGYRYDQWLRRRRNGEPVAYIVGVKEFYGRVFDVSHDVLCPRPDTEILVESSLAEMDRLLALSGAVSVLDVCTGSGCVGITLAAERQSAAVSLSDISPEALDVASRNALRLLGRKLPAYLSDLLAGVPGTFDLIVANPPYVPKAEALRLCDAVRLCDALRDPILALDGGPDGLDYYRLLFPVSFDRVLSGGAVAMEIGEDQAAAVIEIAQRAGFCDVRVARDLGARDRVVVGRRP